MEVHAHSHTLPDPDNHRGRKTWTHYFWEFLMLFLAVFCGFLAENLREHNVERHREHDYMQSMINNVKVDTANLIIYLERNNIRLRFLDSLVSMSKTDLSLPENSDKVYYYYLRTRFFPNYNSNDATITQLKSSGNFRLIRKSNVADSILSYAEENKYIMERSELLRAATVRTWEAASPIMDLTITLDSTYYTRRVLLKSPVHILLNPEKLRALFNSATEEARILTAYIKFLHAQYGKGKLLIDVITQEYHLK